MFLENWVLPLALLCLDKISANGQNSAAKLSQQLDALTKNC